MSKHRKLLYVIVGVILVLLAGELALVIPYFMAENTMQPGAPELRYQEGRTVLSWPEADNADCYRVQIQGPAPWNPEENAIYYDQMPREPRCDLTDLPTDVPLRILVGSVARYRIFGQERERYGERELAAEARLMPPAAGDFRVMPDMNSGNVRISCRLGEGDVLRMARVEQDGTVRELRRTAEPEFQLRFGPDGDFPELGPGDVCHLLFDVLREEEQITFYGGSVGDVPLSRQDFLGQDLDLSCTPIGSNRVRLQWNETRGDTYLVQRKASLEYDWQTVAEIPASEQRVYESGHLSPYTDYLFRVLAVSGQGDGPRIYGAESQTRSYMPQASCIYATVWPNHDLPIYRTSTRQEPFAEAPAGRAYCVLSEENGMFAVRTGREIGYIDSNYCLINLPEYLGRLCAYDITNSYSSIYMVHEYEIPQVTGQVIRGYEHIRMADGSFLVPLLYPTARRLVDAGLTAREMGFRIRIQDAFRPYEATRAIYDQTKSIIHLPLPAATYTGVTVHDLPAPKNGQLTYEEVMTSGAFGLAYFLAMNISHHNRGTAMDLSIEDYYSEQAMQMQTSIHDLSHYSAVPENNDMAHTLKYIMESAGFGGLESEWWHFQDNQANKRLNPPHLLEGVTPECWVKDDFGWRYRQADGSFLSSCTRTVDHILYTFDSEGYAAS